MLLRLSGGWCVSGSGEKTAEVWVSEITCWLLQATGRA